MSTTEIVAVIGAVLGGPAAVGAVKAWERVQTKRIEAEAEEDEDDHAECKREVRGLRQDVSALRSSVDKCEMKHSIALAKVDALDTLVHILVREVRGHDTDPPMAE